MKNLVLIIALVVGAATAGVSEAALDPHLEVFAPYIGKTFEGNLSAEGEEPKIDVQRWEVGLGGKIIKIVHSLDRGAYGGETIIFWDEKLESVAFYYFTTGGFYTHGTMKVGEGIYTAYEEVEGNPDGITAVRSTARVLPDGRIHNRSEYMKDGDWMPGHEVFYKENSEAEVVFE